jgi:cytidine deaminase
LNRTAAKSLLERAKTAADSAHAPYSQLHVGAAILAASGEVYTGCNVENPSFSATMCAERGALSAMVAAEGPAARVKAVASWCSGSNPCYPCGVCLQALLPFCEEGAVLVVEREDGVVDSGTRLSDLLPRAFTGW